MIYSPLGHGGLKIINLHHENKAYLLKLAWNISRNQVHHYLQCSSYRVSNPFVDLSVGVPSISTLPFSAHKTVVSRG